MSFKLSDYVIIGNLNCEDCQKAVQLAQSQKVNYLYFPRDNLNAVDKEYILSLKKSAPYIFYRGRYIGNYMDMFNNFSFNPTSASMLIAASAIYD